MVKGRRLHEAAGGSHSQRRAQKYIFHNVFMISNCSGLFFCARSGNNSKTQQRPRAGYLRYLATRALNSGAVFRPLRK
jgi:hypothetical protein